MLICTKIALQEMLYVDHREHTSDAQTLTDMHPIWYFDQSNQQVPVSVHVKHSSVAEDRMMPRNYLGVQEGRVLGEAGGECLVGGVSLVVAVGCGDGSVLGVGDEHCVALRVAQGQDVDVLHRTITTFSTPHPRKDTSSKTYANAWRPARE